MAVRSYNSQYGLTETDKIVMQTKVSECLSIHDSESKDQSFSMLVSL